MKPKKEATVPNVMARQDADKGEQVAVVPIRRADDKMWMRQHGGDFTQGDIKGDFSSCVGIGGGPVGIINIKRGDVRRQYIIDLNEFVEAVLAVEKKLWP